MAAGAVRAAGVAGRPAAAGRTGGAGGAAYRAGRPGVWALGAGALTWLVRTGLWDLAPRARR